MWESKTKYFNVSSTQDAKRLMSFLFPSLYNSSWTLPAGTLPLSRQTDNIFSYFFQKTGFCYERISRKCQSHVVFFFLYKTKQNISKCRLLKILHIMQNIKESIEDTRALLGLFQCIWEVYLAEDDNVFQQNITGSVPNVNGLKKKTIHMQYCGKRKNMFLNIVCKLMYQNAIGLGNYV